MLAGQELVTTACIGIAMSDNSRQKPDDYLAEIPGQPHTTLVE